MKLLSDFDGVLTDQSGEANRVLEIFTKKLEELGKLVKTGAVKGPEIAGLMTLVKSEVLTSPQNYGWTIEGRISAFGDEDLFILAMGITSVLNHWAKGEGTPWNAAARRLATVAQQQGKTFDSLRDDAFNEMLEETHQGKLKPMDPEAAPLLRKLLDEGHEVVIVSNSATDRILELLHNEGLKDHPRLRVRGGAKKFLLTSDRPASVNMDGRTVPVDRPTYEKILLEEKPDVVMGDVVSLDLTLPYHLYTTKPGWVGMPRLVLRLRHYTPPWSRSWAKRHKHEAVQIVELDHLRNFTTKVKF